MADGINLTHAEAVPQAEFPRAMHGLYGGFGLLIISLLAAVFLPRGLVLAAFGDTVQVGLVAAATAFAFRNVLHSRARERIFWLLISTGALLWTVSNGTWAIYELWFARPVPDLPIVDVLLFLKIVPLTAAIAVAPNQDNQKSFRSFGLLDVFVLMIYSLYLFSFAVFAYRLLPGAEAIYNFRFNAAAAIGNQTLVVVSGIAALRARGYWRGVYRAYFFCAVLYALGSNLCNFAIDLGRYYTGSLYDVPLVASLIAFVCLTLAGGRSVQLQQSMTPPKGADATSGHTTFVSEHLAMLVALSTPIIGFWLLSSSSAPPQLQSFRVAITLMTIFLLTLLLSIKQDILAAGLFESLQQLSDTYSRIERFKTHLTQSEKLASLGELVAQVAKQIKSCMVSILEASTRLTSRPDVDARIQNMAGKIGQYAQRTDVLVDNMLHFAKKTPLCLAPLDIKPVLESALHLSRVAKLAQIRVDLTHEAECPMVRGDSSQLLLVFLQLISNAVDALSETQGGTLDISSRISGSNLVMEFADSGPGIKEPQRVFEPFYTTKPVGKGTGLGLSTCYGIIQQHEGEITCRNRTEGGAIFLVSLPTVLPAPTEKSGLAEALIAEGVL